MKYNVIETDEIVIGKKNEIIKYLSEMEDVVSRNEHLDVQDRINEIKEIHKIMKQIEDIYYNMDVIYLRRNWNHDLIVRYLDLDLL